MDEEPKLPPIEEETFDGYKEEAPIHRDIPLTPKCNHKNIQIISGNELRCSCGVGFTGTNIMELYKTLTR